MSLYAAFVIALPIVLWQLWSFFAPAFEQRTQRGVRWLVAFATGLTVCGILFGYYIVLPAALKFLTHYDSSLYNIQIRAKDYYSFVSLVLLAVSVVFQMPLFILGLVRIGRADARKLRRNWRIGIVAMTALAVALPGHRPGDDAPRDGAADHALPRSRSGSRASSSAAGVPIGRTRRGVTELSADWVLPVDGPPIEGGVVRWEDGAIVAVGAGPRRAPLRRRGDRARAS